MFNLQLEPPTDTNPHITHGRHLTRNDYLTVSPTPQLVTPDTKLHRRRSSTMKSGVTQVHVIRDSIPSPLVYQSTTMQLCMLTQRMFRASENKPTESHTINPACHRSGRIDNR